MECKHLFKYRSIECEAPKWGVGGEQKGES